MKNRKLFFFQMERRRHHRCNRGIYSSVAFEVKKTRKKRPKPVQTSIFISPCFHYVFHANVVYAETSILHFMTGLG